MKRIIITAFMIFGLVFNKTNVFAMTEINMGSFLCTAYCSCEECSEGYGRLTSTGHYARSNHTVAVDPNVIGYGTILMIDDTEYVAEDCGGNVRGDHIDIFFDTHEEVEEFGVKYRNVWITGRAKDGRSDK